MPKGQPRDAKTRAQIIDDRIKALRDQKHGILSDDAAKIKLDRERKAKLMGFTLLDLRDAGEITPQEVVTVSRLLGRRVGPEPKHWNLLADWLPPAKPEIAKPPANDPISDAAQ